jgi:organic hydroperoxide reductase OsmC/OhrA
VEAAGGTGSRGVATMAAAQAVTFAVEGTRSAAERSGAVALGGGQTVTVTPPAAFGGAAAGTNPEELRLAAAATCSMMGLGRLCARQGFAGQPLRVAVTGEVTRTADGLRFDRIRLQPVFRAAGLDAAGRARLAQLAEEAEAACCIARTLHPVVPYAVAPCFAAA